MHTEEHSTQNTIPQIGDMLMRLCGTFGVVERIDEAHIMHVRLLHSPRFDVQHEEPMRVRTDSIGISWGIVA